MTFAAMFALALFGFSAIGGLRHLLHHIGAPWYLWLLLPIVLITALARWEAEWIPDADRRRRYAWAIVGGAILLVALAAKLRPDSPHRERNVTAPASFKR